MSLRRRGPAVVALVVAWMLAASAGSTRVLAADAGASSAPAWLDEVTLNGFLSGSYSYNFNQPDSRTNQLRVFDFADNTFKLDVFELVAQHAVAKPHEAGFRVDLALGSSVPRVSSSLGLFRTDSSAEDVDLQQAFLSYVAPVGSGLRLDLGKFVTPFGYELIPGYDGWNDNATRSFLYGFATPFTHTGARATYACSKRVTGVLMLVNGWDVAQDNNRSKSVGGQLQITPTPPLSISLGGMIGAERANHEGDPRSLFDAIAVWKPSERFTLGANADWGSEQGAVTAGQNATWSGYAGYARGSFGNWALSLRGESFDDADGARTGTAQKLTSFTVTPEARLTPHMLVRSDLRVDHSSTQAFEKGSGVTDSQPTALIEMLYSF